MSEPDFKVDLKSIINPWNIFISAVFYCLGVLVAFVVFREIDRLPFILNKDLTKLVVGIILALLKGYIDDVFKLNNDSMSTAIEKAIQRGLSTINSHFESKNPLFPETTKDGIVVRLNSHFEEGGIIDTIQGDVSILKSHFEEGGIIPNLSNKIDTLESHFEGNGVIPQILEQLKALREEKSPENLREKTR